MASVETFLVRAKRVIGRIFKCSIDQGYASEMMMVGFDYK